jgi:FkbM family methyltransferase
VSREYLEAQKRSMAESRKAFGDDPKSVVAIGINEHYMIVQMPYGQLLLNKHDPTMVSNIYESMSEIALLVPFAQGMVIDVGANVGTHSICFANSARRVYAIEAHPQTYLHLCANIILNQKLNIEPINLALGDMDGPQLMADIDPTKPSTPMGARVGAGITPIKMARLDSLNLDADFMKIDVEGYELEVLKGAKHTLMRNDTAVFVEIHHHELVQEINDYMAALGYSNAPLLENRYIDNVTLLTEGYMYWKGERIVWIEQPSLPESRVKMAVI